MYLGNRPKQRVQIQIKDCHRSPIPSIAYEHAKTTASPRFSALGTLLYPLVTPVSIR